jgi:TPR repeat protein
MTPAGSKLFCRLAIFPLAALLTAASPLPGPKVRLASLPTASTTDLLSTGLEAYNRGDHATARALFRQLAERDVAAAETLLGTMTANGQGGPRDDAVAAAWFLRAARRGYAPAQLALADAFARGRGVKKDTARAQALARAAAIQGQPGAAQLAARFAPAQLALVAAPRL